MRRPILIAAMWCALIYATIPFARTLQRFVASSPVGSVAFQYLVISFLMISVVSLIVWLRRLKPAPAQYFWLAVVGGVFVYYTLQLDRSPEEAVHFAEYGVLSVLIFRALGRWVGDLTIYFTSAIIGGTAGAGDELIQAITPARVWDLRDIGLNFFAVALTQLGIFLVVRPTYDRISGRSVKLFCRASFIGVLLLGASMVALVEHGYLYDDPQIGIFRSRFTPGELQQLDGQPSAPQKYLREMQVHIFRRDHYVSTNPTISFRENQILEKYYPLTTSRINFTWSATKTAEIRGKSSLTDTYESPVSEGLFTLIRRPTLIAAIVAVLLALAVAERLATRLP